MKHFLPIVLTALFYLSSPVFAMEIGVVDLNEALNQSEAGIRSKNGIRVINCNNIETSFPNFKDIMNSIGMKINAND